MEDFKQTILRILDEAAETLSDDDFEELLDQVTDNIDSSYPYDLDDDDLDDDFDDEDDEYCDIVDDCEYDGEN